MARKNNADTTHVLIGAVVRFMLGFVVGGAISLVGLLRIAHLGNGTIIALTIIGATISGALAVILGQEFWNMLGRRGDL